MENARLSYLESIDWDNEIMIVKASRQEDYIMLLKLLAPKSSPLAAIAHITSLSPLAPLALLTPQFLQLL